MKRQHNLTPMERIERRRTITPTGCWETPFLPSKDYPSLKIAGRHVLVHRISFEHYKGPIPAGMLVCHECDNPRCHNPKHLFLGTYLDNILDMCAKGRNGLRPPSPNTDAIISLAHLTQDEIADQLGVSQPTVSRVLRAAGRSRGKETSFGKASVGGSHGRAKVTEADIPIIRKDTRQLAQIAVQYGVASATIYAIKQRTNWKHVADK